MKRKSSSAQKKKKLSAADLLLSPPPPAAANRSATANRSAAASPLQFDFNVAGAAVSPAAVKTVVSIGELKEMSSSKMESIKRYLDRSHSEIVKDIDASNSRLHKRFKIQTQACQQVMDEAEKECKKMSDRISESKESLKASYSEFMAEAQASALHVCKSSIPELSQSFDKALDVLRSRYGAVASI